MKITIRHRLTLSIESGAAHAVEHLLLTPQSGPTQTVRDWSVEMSGIEAATRFTDAFGNQAMLVAQTKPEGTLAVTATGTVETIDRAGVLGRIAGEPVVALYRRVTEATRPDPGLLATFKTADRHGPARIALFHAIMDRIGELYRWDGAPEEPASSQSPGEMTQTQAMGDMSQSQAVVPPSSDVETEAPDERPAADAGALAQLFVGTVRALGLPARYVTGYLAGEGDEPAVFHAWAEAYDDGLGWIGFDAALGICPTDRHVRVAAGLDAASVPPIRVVPQAADPQLVEVELAAQ